MLEKSNHKAPAQSKREEKRRRRFVRPLDEKLSHSEESHSEESSWGESSSGEFSSGENSSGENSGESFWGAISVGEGVLVWEGAWWRVWEVRGDGFDVCVSRGVDLEFVECVEERV